MDIIKTPPYSEMQSTYSRLFSLGHLGIDINSKFALISLVCYLQYKLSQKKSDVTHFNVLKKIAPNLPEDFLKGLAVVCSDFGYSCTSFPTFGIEDKKIPSKIKELLNSYSPF